MSRLQPIGQKKLTNICVVRYKRCGKRFEVAAYRNTVYSWRNASEKDKAAMLLSDEVLQARTVFTNLEQGVAAKSEDLIEAFGTDDEEAVCVEVLTKGEFQVSEEERQAQVEQLFRDVVTRVTDMCVNPETRMPYPLTTIERYMKETMHFVPSTTKSAKQQALMVVRQLEQSTDFPVRRAQMRLRLRLPDKGSLPSVRQALDDLATANERDAGARAGGSGLQVLAHEELKDEVCVDCVADPHLYRDIGQIAASCRGSLQVLELKAYAEADPASAEANAAATAAANAAAASAAASVSLRQVAAHGDSTAGIVGTAAAVVPASGSANGATTANGATRAAAAAAVEDDIFARAKPSVGPAGGRGGGGGARGMTGGKGAAGGKGGKGADPAAAARKAERMFKLNARNAENGDPVACLELGKAYLDGVGCAVDPEQGRHWLQQAALHGVNAATERLEALNLAG